MWLSITKELESYTYMTFYYKKLESYTQWISNTRKLESYTHVTLCYKKINIIITEEYEHDIMEERKVQSYWLRAVNHS